MHDALETYRFEITRKAKAMARASFDEAAALGGRRGKQVFMTRNTEYHCINGVCIAVHDRRTGRWVDDHPALDVRAVGGIEDGDDGRIHFREPEVGKPLVFYPKGIRGIVTSRVLLILGSRKETLPNFPPLAARR